MLTPSSAGVSLNSGSAYVPPYLRARQAQQAKVPAPFNGAAPTPAHASGNGYRPSPTGLPTPAPTPVQNAGAYNPPRGGNDGGWGPRGGGRGGDRFERGTAPGAGAWRDGKHITGARNPRLEKELYGEEGDGTHQVSLQQDGAHLFHMGGKRYEDNRADVFPVYWYQLRQVCRHPR